jgi:hypothetical protein
MNAGADYSSKEHTQYTSSTSFFVFFVSGSNIALPSTSRPSGSITKKRTTIDI